MATENQPQEEADTERLSGREGSFVQRLRKRFGSDVDPEITLQDEDQDPEESVSKGLYLKLSTKDPASMRYTVRGELARGGMGAILRVWDDDLRRNLAMKVLLSRGVNEEDEEEPKIDDELLGRFLEEAQITGQLDHPGIVPVHDLGIDERGRVYFTMRLVRGRDLKQILDLMAEGKEGWSRTKLLYVILKVCEAMAFAHSKGVVHRDLKPANIMVGRFGETYVMDWGLARVLGRRDSRDIRLKPADASALSLVRTARQEDHETDPQSPLVTMDGDVIGTPSYMALEQAEGKLDEVGPRSDVYSVGAILYQMLTGQAPYVKPNAKISPHTVLSRVLDGPPTPIAKLNKDVPGELIAICEKAMGRGQAERYMSMLDMSADIEAYLEGRVVRAYEGGSVAEFRKWMQRNRGMAAAILVAILLAVGGLASVAAVQASKTAELELTNTQLEDAKNKAIENENNARLAEQTALEREAEAKAAKDLADENAKAAQENLLIAQQRSYQANIAAADYSVQLNDVAEAKNLLALCDEEFREWEWDHLQLKTENQHANVEDFTPAFADLVATRDGHRIVALSRDGLLRVYDLPTGSVVPEQWADARLWLFTMRPHVDFSLSEDGSRIAIIGVREGRIVLSDSSSLNGAPDGFDVGKKGTYLRTLPEGDAEGFEEAAALCCEFAPEGDLIAAGFDDGAVAVWDHTTGELQHRFEGHAGKVNQLAWSPAGILASASEDGTTRLWNVASGEALGTLEGHEGAVVCVAFDSDGALVASGGADQRVRLWETSTQRQIRSISGHKAAVTSLAFQPDGKHLVSAGPDLTVRVFDLDTERTKVFLGHEDSILALAFSSDGSLILSSSEDTTLRTWDPEIGGAYTSLIGAEYRLDDAPVRMGFVYSVDFHPDGSQCLTGHNDGTVSIWDAWSGELINVLRGHEQIVSSAVWNEEGTRILTGSLDKTAILWDAQSGRPMQTFRGHSKWIRAVAFGPGGDGGDWVVTASGDETARVWDARTGEVLQTLEGHKKWVNAVAVAPGTNHVWTASIDRSLRLWDAKTGDVLRLIEDLPGGVQRIAVSPDGRSIAAGCEEGTIQVWDTETGTLRYSRKRGEDPVRALAYSRSGKRLVSGYTDGTLRLWNAATGDLLILLRGHTGAITCGVFNHDDTRILTGSSPILTREEDRIGAKDVVARIWESGSRDVRREERRRAEQARRQADPLVASLFSNYFYAHEVVKRLEQQGLPKEVLEAARRLALARGDNAGRLAEETWNVVWRSDRSKDEYSQAMDRAEAAVAIEPEDRFCAVVLGGAQYRLNYLPAAHQTLKQALALDAGSVRSQIGLFCLLGMTQFRLGRIEEAEQTVAALRKLVTEWANSNPTDKDEIASLQSLLLETSRTLGIPLITPDSSGM